MESNYENFACFMDSSRPLGNRWLQGLFVEGIEKIMKKQHSSLAMVLAAALAVASSTTSFAADRGGRDAGNDGIGGRDHDSNAGDVWPEHQNECAVGNSPPPGANCATDASGAAKTTKHRRSG